MPEFIPIGYVTLHEALARVGEALVDGWDGSETAVQVPSEDDVTLAAGVTWVDREYDQRMWSVGLSRLCPPSAEAVARLAKAVAQVRDRVPGEFLQLFFLGDEGYQPVPLRAVLRDDAIFMTGRYGGFGQSEVVLVCEDELAALLAPTAEVNIIAGATSKPPDTHRSTRARPKLRAAVAEVIRSAWPNGTPQHLTAGRRDEHIIRECKSRGIGTPSPRTINRAMKLLEPERAN